MRLPKCPSAAHPLGGELHCEDSDERHFFPSRASKGLVLLARLPNSPVTGQVVMLHAGQVEIVAIVMPLIFGQSLLILCGYFTNIFGYSQAFKALLCILIIIKVLSSKFYEIQ